MIPFVWALLRRWLVGDDQRQQIRASQALLVLSVYVVFAGVQHGEVLLGMIDEAASWRLTAYNLFGGVLFYALIRSGLNLRLPWDRALTGPQTLWAMVAISWSYAITGPARGAVVLIMMPLILLGMFVLSPRQSRRLTAAGFVLLGSVMVWKGWTDPLRYDPRVEAMHFVFAGIVMGTCAVLSPPAFATRGAACRSRRGAAAHPGACDARRSHRPAEPPCRARAPASRTA